MPLLSDTPDVQTVPFYIGGELLTQAEHTFPVVSARRGETIFEALSADATAAQKACDAAGKAFASWKHATHVERRTLLFKVADVFEERRAQLVKLQQDETSCEGPWAQQNVTLAVAYLREIACCISSLSGTIPQVEKPNTMGFIFKEPIGVVLTIPPWNAALILSTRAVASAIGAGCAVVLKSSELCPRTHFAMVEAFYDAGAPPGLINSLQVRREDAAHVTEALIKHEAVRKIEFIGSAGVGKIVAATAAKYLKPVLLELGSKTPSIVLDDADLKRAAALSAHGALLHQGQICFSTERVIVQQKVAEEFKGLLVEAVRSYKSDGTSVTTGIAQHAFEVLEDAKNHGHEFLVGGPIYSGEATLEPSIVLAPKDSRIVEEETFGPSMSLYVVEDDNEAIQLANRTSYGLNATIHSANMGRALNMARELEYGQVHINTISIYTSATAPQKGVKGSGWGRQNGRWGLEEFLVEKFVSYQA